MKKIIHSLLSSSVKKKIDSVEKITNGITIRPAPLGVGIS